MSNGENTPVAGSTPVARTSSSVMMNTGAGIVQKEVSEKNLEASWNSMSAQIMGISNKLFQAGSVTRRKGWRYCRLWEKYFRTSIRICQNQKDLKLKLQVL